MTPKRILMAVPLAAVLVGSALAHFQVVLPSPDIVTAEGTRDVALDILFLRSAITVGANNAANAISDNDASEILGFASIAATDYLNLTNNQVGQASNIGLVLEPEINDGDSSRSVWMAITTTGTPTYASGVLTVKVGVLRG